MTNSLDEPTVSTLLDRLYAEADASHERFKRSMAEKSPEELAAWRASAADYRALYQTAKDVYLAAPRSTRACSISWLAANGPAPSSSSARPSATRRCTWRLRYAITVAVSSSGPSSNLGKSPKHIATSPRRDWPTWSRSERVTRSTPWPTTFRR